MPLSLVQPAISQVHALRCIALIGFAKPVNRDDAGRGITLQKRNLIRAVCARRDEFGRGRWRPWFFRSEVSAGLHVGDLVGGALVTCGGLAILALQLTSFPWTVENYVSAAIGLLIPIIHWRWGEGGAARFEATRHISRTFAAQGLCPACGYGLAASDSQAHRVNRCPECGGQWRCAAGSSFTTSTSQTRVRKPAEVRRETVACRSRL